MSSCDRIYYNKDGEGKICGGIIIFDEKEYTYRCDRCYWMTAEIKPTDISPFLPKNMNNINNINDINESSYSYQKIDHLKSWLERYENKFK